ncbi:MAG: alpha/beta hydrolase [Caulobacter sp.]
MIRSSLAAALSLALLAPSALVAEPFTPTPVEAQQLILLSKPAADFIARLKGPRETVDGQTLDPKLQFVLEQTRPFATAEAAAREQAAFKTPAGRAAFRAAGERRWLLTSKVTAPMRTVTDRNIPSRGGALAVRVYRPQTGDDAPLPVLVYFHGGGWIFGSIEAVDRSVSLIANEAKVIVVSVAYRLAPEHPYPAASDDGEDAYAWAKAHAAEFGGDAANIAVGGDSAGGHVAVNISQRLAAQRQPAPTMQLLYYPAVDLSGDYRSYELFGEGYGLDKAFADFVRPTVFGSRDLADGQVSPLKAKSLKGLPATILTTGGFDILRDSNRRFARRLEADGVAVTFLSYPSLNHSFLQQSGVIEEADRAAVETARLFGTAVRSRATLLASENRSAAAPKR